MGLTRIVCATTRVPSNTQGIWLATTLSRTTSIHRNPRPREFQRKFSRFGAGVSGDTVNGADENLGGAKAADTQLLIQETRDESSVLHPSRLHRQQRPGEPVYAIEMPVVGDEVRAGFHRVRGDPDIV